MAVTDQTGQTTKGVVTQLPASSMTLDDSTGAARLFDETSLRKIRLLYSPKHDVLFGLGAGASFGALAAVHSAGLRGCYNKRDPVDDCHVLRAAAAVGGGLGAVIGMTIGAMQYLFNTAFDVYRGDTRSARTPAIAVAPQVTHTRKGVLVSVRFRHVRNYQD